MEFYPSFLGTDVKVCLYPGRWSCCGQTCYHKTPPCPYSKQPLGKIGKDCITNEIIRDIPTCNIGTTSAEMLDEYNQSLAPLSLNHWQEVKKNYNNFIPNLPPLFSFNSARNYPSCPGELVDFESTRFVVKMKNFEI